jgi:hypothetical protein
MRGKKEEEIPWTTLLVDMLMNGSGVKAWCRIDNNIYEKGSSPPFFETDKPLYIISKGFSLLGSMYAHLGCRRLLRKTGPILN